MNINKEFMPSVANTIGTDLTKYKVIKKNQFAYNPMQVGRDRTIRVARYPNDDSAIISPAYKIFQVIDGNVLLPEFLMLYFLRPEFDRVCWFHTDSSIRGSMDWSKFCDLEIPIPPIEIQKKIVDIYHFFNERIELKERINNNLEKFSSALAIHIFKNNENEYIELKEISKFIKGRKPKNISEIKENNFINYLTIEVLTNQNNSYAFDNKGIKANEYDILIVMDGASSGKLFFGKKGLVGSTLAKLETDEKYQEIVYQFLKIKESFICENTTGTAIPHTDKSLVLNLQCPMSEDILKFSETFKTIRLNIISNNNEINKLQKLRDTLLPKLMSGDIK